MINGKTRGILILLTVPLAILWGFVLLIGGKPAVISWWLLQASGLVGIIFLILSILQMVKERRPNRFSILTLIFSLIAIWPLLWLVNIGRIAFPVDLESTEPAVSIRSPFNETVLTGWGGDSIKTNYHVVVPVERWAYDIIKQPASIDSPNLFEYGIYGLKIFAPASGTVVQLQRDLPDHPPGDYPVDFQEMKGNFLYLKLDQTGTYLMLAHFMKDSILVEAGQHVSEGELLGRVGNSGNSSEPHLHIHHQKDSPFESSIFTAHGLPLYFRQRGVSRMPEGGIIEKDGKSYPCGEELLPNIRNF